MSMIGQLIQLGLNLTGKKVNCVYGFKIGGVEQYKRQVVVTLTEDETGGGILSWANPEGETILITSLIINLTTASTGAGTADFGVAAAATTLSDTLMDGIDTNAAVGVFDIVEDEGTNGVGAQLMTSGQFLTGSAKTGDAAGLAGKAFIEYTKIPS